MNAVSSQIPATYHRLGSSWGNGLEGYVGSPVGARTISPLENFQFWGCPRYTKLTLVPVVVHCSHNSSTVEVDCCYELRSMLPWVYQVPMRCQCTCFNLLMDDVLYFRVSWIKQFSPLFCILPQTICVYNSAKLQSRAVFNLLVSCTPWSVG